MMFPIARALEPSQSGIGVSGCEGLHHPLPIEELPSPSSSLLRSFLQGLHGFLGPEAWAGASPGFRPSSLGRLQPGEAPA